MIVEAEAGKQPAGDGDGVPQNNAHHAEISPFFPDMDSECDEKEGDNKNPKGIGEKKTQPNYKPLQNGNIFFLRLRIIPAVKVFLDKKYRHSREMSDNNENDPDDGPNVAHRLSPNGGNTPENENMNGLIPNVKKCVIRPTAVDH